MSARGRGAVPTSHLLTKASAFQEGQPLVSRRAQGLVVSWASAQGSLSLLRSQQHSHGQGRLGREHTCSQLRPLPPARPAHMVERHPAPSLRAAPLSSSLLSSQSAQDGTPAFTEETFHLQVQKTCSSARQEPPVANTSGNVFWTTQDMNK